MPKVLSDHPDIRQLRRQAKELLKSARSGDAEATKQLADAAAKPEQPPSLSNAQLVVAREYGFDSWPKLRLAVADANGETTEPLPTGPMFRTKYRSKDPVYTPKKFLDGALAAGWEPGRLPDSLIFTFHNVYAKLLAEDDRFEINTKLAPSNSILIICPIGEAGLSPSRRLTKKPFVEGLLPNDAVQLISVPKSESFLYNQYASFNLIVSVVSVSFVTQSNVSIP